jgi:uncharacterized ion transporter superfamily protein YfcC
MIIDHKTVAVTLIVIVVALYWGLGFIRKFALQIAQENHDAVVKMDQQEEQQRLKKERNADSAAAAAFAKVEPMLKVQQVQQIQPTKEAPQETTEASAADV